MNSGGGGGGGFGYNVPRARNMKARKQTSNNNDNNMFSSYLDARVAGDDLGSGFGFNRLRSSSESVFGNVSSGNVGKGDNNVVVDDMSKPNISNETSSLQTEGVDNIIDGNAGLDLENEIKKMDVNDHGDEKVVEFAFTSKLNDVRVTNVEFKAPDTRGNMFSGWNRFEPRNEHVRETRSRKKKGKLKKPVVSQSRIIEDFVFGRRDSFGSSDGFDIPLYDERLAGSYSRETSVTSDASQIDEQDNVSNDSRALTSNFTTDDESLEPQINEVSETESFMTATENLESGFDTDVSSTASSRRQESGVTRVFSFGSRSEDFSNGEFTFAASSSGQSQLTSDTRQHKKKPPLKVTRDPYISTKSEFFPVDFSASSSLKKDTLKLVNERDFLRHESITSTSLSSGIAAEEACEKWRLRGNQAYSNGDLAKAEDYYTQGLNSVSENEKSASCLKALMLCYSNRAAARISRGRMKDALEDCLMAANIDPDFLKVQIRAAHCYLAIGEIENAKRQYMKCLEFGNENSVDGKVISEASEGLEKVQKVLDCIEQCTDLLRRRASEDLEHALRLVNDALQISACSDKLLQIKADSLFMLRRYEEVIKTLMSDEADTPTSSSFRLCRSNLIIKSYFYLGRLDEALEFIKKQENLDHVTIPLADTIRELLSHKTAGNEAFKSGKFSEAIEHYTAALSCSVESRIFASVCFCNRAAAYKALGHITDGIADCSLAIALDSHYLKAKSKRASLYEMIRDYGQAAKDLQRLVSLLKTQDLNELKQTQIQLSNVEAESRKGITLNAYLILGVESTASAADIKKAYRKAALKHHPDKAAQSLSRSDDGDDGLWKEIAKNVHKDADRLFKMIGEAYAVLSDPSKRLKYDKDEEKRNEVKKFTRSNSSRMTLDVQNSVFDQSGTRQPRQDSRRAYVRTHSTGSESTGSSYMYSKYY
ncbi:uncharacterized protein LOC143607474 [Bidens hawaiensis]|uniref:uncharacterized protein LOC143607474 n=1 Tax=Bidens hawaiensis TaxID=980011 RepID=UPI00404936A4